MPPLQYGTYAVPRADLGEAYHEYDMSAAGFIAQDVFPDRPVTKKAATVSVITRESILKRANSLHANGAVFNRIGIGGEDLAYSCRDRGLEAQLTDTDRANYVSDFDAELETVDILRHKILMEKEIRVATLTFNTNTWTGAALFTDNSGSPWSTAATEVIAQVQAVKEKVREATGMVPETLVIGEKALNNMLKNTGIIARFPGITVLTEAVLRSQLAGILGLRELFVGRKTYDSADEGQSFTAADVWSGSYAMVLRRNTGGLRSGGLGRTFRWQLMDTGGVPIVQYREVQTESDIFRGREFVEEKVFDAAFAHLMQIEA